MIAEEIKSLIQEATGSLGLEAGDFVVEHPADLSFGDYATNVAVKYGHKEQIIRHIVKNKPEWIERVELAGPGFINFYLSKEFFQQNIGEIIEKGNEFGKSEDFKNKKVMVEHTQPNPFKDFHIGHLMNNVIGEAVANIFKMNGAEVRTASYHGDVGLHVAKAIWGKMEKPELAWGKAYAYGDEYYEAHKEEIIEINKKIYDKSDSSLNTLYGKGRKESLEAFEAIYKRLDSYFDYHFYESEAGELGKKIVLAHLSQVFEESEGAVIFKGEKFGLHTRVFLNSEGLPTYEAKEVGLAEIKKNLFSYDWSITVTANEQDAFFNVVEVAIGEVFPELKGKLKHLSHGILKLPSGKMSSRMGQIISAESLIEEVKQKVRGNEAVAIGAIKYMILRQAIGNDIIFNVEKSVSIEGDSGVYLQYAYTRTNSLLERAKNQGATLTHCQDVILTGRGIHKVEKLLYRFPEIVDRAGREYAPHYITTYLTELASSFNNFYAHEQIIDNSPGSSYCLAITKAFNVVMKNGLTILGIPTPERI